MKSKILMTSLGAAAVLVSASAAITEAIIFMAGSDQFRLVRTSYAAPVRGITYSHCWLFTWWHRIGNGRTLDMAAADQDTGF